MGIPVVLFYDISKVTNGGTKMEYSLLKEDLDFLIDRYEAGSFKKSKNQGAIWYKEGRKHAITHPMFGSDHPKSLQLLVEDGYDGLPLTGVSQRTAESFWDYNDNHVFPDSQSLARIGEFFHLDLYRTLIMILKGQWEQYFGHQVMEYRVNLEKYLGDILFLSDEKVVLAALKKFCCDSQSLFDLLELTGAKASKIGYNRKTFESLVYTLISGRYFFMAIESTEVKAFAVNERKQLRVIKSGTKEEREEYETLHLEYAHKQNRLDELSMELEGFRLKNEETGREYLVEFGAFELELLQEKSRFDELDTKFNIIAADRSISMEGNQGKCGGSY
jgi:hypothetical protein